MRPELIPLLVVALLMLSAGGGEVDRVEILVDGDHTIDQLDHALIVGDATVTVPDTATVSGPIYVIAGDTRIRGTGDGDVVQLAGNLTVQEEAIIEGELRLVGGVRTIAPGAAIAERTSFEPVPQESSPAARIVAFVLQSLVLGVSGFGLARWKPTLLANVGDSITDHVLVSGTVGLLASVTLLALFVFMAFTLILLPISVLGILVGLLVVGYSVVVYGFLVGQHLPFERPGLASAVGSVLFLGVLTVLPRIPIVGSWLGITLVTVGIGATLVTYFGLRRFEPVQLPE
ncbi:polymer-forming cytoskeletal protein (plasmid) [Halorussus limi]|uniref:Polymer-forming cytoskeletal protein n=1 Tax=Halorussus limi TaxID=2938695 RepID=A0A8U0I0X9_9EURY|nr:polymer-forming cytoskeletal protein [Halorussus limi]UPV76683.1 polymer-forming cytoskeletal protein [Halorussus limi]